jgi:hypothetical protein
MKSTISNALLAAMSLALCGCDLLNPFLKTLTERAYGARDGSTPTDPLFAEADAALAAVVKCGDVAAQQAYLNLFNLKVGWFNRHFEDDPMDATFRHEMRQLIEEAWQATGRCSDPRVARQARVRGVGGGQLSLHLPPGFATGANIVPPPQGPYYNQDVFGSQNITVPVVTQPIQQQPRQPSGGGGPLAPPTSLPPASSPGPPPPPPAQSPTPGCGE